MHGTLFVGTAVLFVMFILTTCFNCNRHLQMSGMEQLNCTYCIVPLFMIHAEYVLCGCLPEDKHYIHYSCNTGCSYADRLVMYIIMYEW